MTDGHVPRDTGRSVFGVDPGGYHAARIDYPDELYRQITPTDARGLYASYSFVRTLASNRRATLLDAVAALVEDKFGGFPPMCC